MFTDAGKVLFLYHIYYMRLALHECIQEFGSEHKEKYNILSFFYLATLFWTPLVVFEDHFLTVINLHT